MRKLAWIAAAAAVLALIAVVGFRLLGGEGASAAGGTVNFDVDPEIAGNSANSLGTVQGCYEVTVASPSFDGVADHQIDVVVTGDTQAPYAYGLRLLYDQTKVRIVNGTSTNILIKTPPDAAHGNDPCVSQGEGPPDSDGSFNPGCVYFGAGQGIPGNGTLVRVGLDIGASGLVTFSMGAAPFTGYSSAAGIHPITRDTGQLAINTPCPKFADVEIVSQAVKASNCTSDPPASLAAGTPTTLCLRKSINNKGPETPVAGGITTTLTQVGGSDCTITADGGNPTTYTGLVKDTPVNVDEKFTVNCANPSTHNFSFQNAITVTTSGVTDPVTGNNSATTPFSTDVLAVADLQVTSATVDAPASAGQGGTFNVTVNANVTNAGPYTPVYADVTFNLDLTGATGCSKSPVGSQTVQDLILGTFSPWATWSVTCSTTGSKTFNGGATVVLDDDAHISNPDSNDTASDPDGDSTNITASADARILTWVFPDDLKPPAAVGPAETGDGCKNAVDDDNDTVVNDGCPDIAGNQVLVDPGVAEDVVAPETLDNVPGPPNTTYTDTSITVSIALTQTPDANCSATPDGGNPTQATLWLNGNDVTVTPNETWDVTLNTGDSCTIDFGKTIAITTGGVGEYNAADNIAARSVDLVADSDGDTVPDNYNGLDDNCDGIANPDQADVDGDDIGDVCDADNDNDGICDAGKSAAYCTGSDNCRLIANAGQEDADTDTIGNVCELDVTCDGLLDGGDVVQLLRYILGLRTLSDLCPPPAGSINGPRATAYNDGIDGGDAVAMLQCIAGPPFHNIVCPLAGD